MIKLKHITKAILFTFIAINSYYVFANTDNDKNKVLLHQTASEVDKIFGNKIDEYTIIIGANFDDTINQFTYYYVVSPDIWNDLLYATNELKNNIKIGLMDKELTTFINVLISNKTTLIYNYECKNEYFDIIFSVDELKKLR